MNELSRLQAKKSKLVIGLISGTSLDGIDTILVRIKGSGVSVKYQQIAFETYPYPKEVRRLILQNSVAGSGSVDSIARLNFLVGELFAEAATRLTRSAGLSLSRIDLIGSHGQTIHHLPQPERFGGRKVRSTLQIGDPSVISKRTGVPTVGDFRVADMALGGEGAPLVPYLDYLLFRSRTKNRGLLNIGGIANITILPQNCSLEDVWAFDTGPGNMVIDALMKKLYKRPYDRDGRTALAGEPSDTLLRQLATHSFLKKRPPKSTGREEFGEEFVQRFLRLGSEVRKSSLISTATEFTAFCVYGSYRRFVRRRTKLDELIVSGGGVHNKALMAALQKYFGAVPVKTLGEYGVSADAKEALCFALLANETIAGHPSNLPSVTGAEKPTILGKICL